jgi:hypothetical protein
MKLDEILKMDKTSDEFFEIYKKISERYWDFDNPSDLQKAAKALVMFAERYDAGKIILCIKIAESITTMTKNNPVTGHIVFEKEEYYFDIYENEASKDSLKKALNKVGGSIKKGSLSKKYLKKETE